MPYTPAQWAAIQATLPSEDQTSYADYAKAVGISPLQQFQMAESAAATPAPVSVSAAESAAAARAKAAAEAKVSSDAAAKQAAEDAYYTVKVGNTGKTQAQLDALDNAIKTASEITGAYGDIGITSTVDPKTGKVVTTNNTAAKIAADKAAAEAAAKAAADKAAADKKAAEAAIAAAKTAQELADAKAQLIAANKAAADAAAKAAADAKAAKDKADAELAAAKAAGDAKATAAAESAAKAAAEAAANAAAEASAKAAQSNLNVSGNVVTPFAGKTAADIAAEAETNRLAEAAALKESQRQDTIKILTDRFTKYNLGSLAKKIQDLAIDGATEATITLSLQETEEYKTRFKANEARIKKGLQVLNPAEYLNVEDGYRQVLRSYGLKQFDTDDYVSQFIANDVSPTEFSNRVVTAVQRVQNSDPAITQQLRDYYGIGTQDLVAYVLDPEQQFQKIERQVAAAEIGAAAKRQGLEAGVSVAEQLAAQGVTQAEAQKGYATIADILPTSEKLSQIYGSTMEQYGQSEAEQEVFNSLASAQRKRQRLSAREVAQFSGSAGLSRNALTNQTSGNI